MSRLVQELPQTPSRMWPLNTGDCLGGKSSAKVMKRYLLGHPPVRKLKKGYFSHWYFLKVYQDPAFVIRVACQKAFLAVDFKQGFWSFSCFHFWLPATVCIFILGCQVGSLQNKSQYWLVLGLLKVFYF